MTAAGLFAVLPTLGWILGLRRWYTKVCCFLFGHTVDNRAFAAAGGGTRICRCGTPFLAENGSLTRISHTPSCFLFGHSYVPMGDRSGHNEYVCTRCGHPLLFELQSDPYGQARSFQKKVRYLCNLFGHRVHEVGDRGPLQEYACGCGHSFLRAIKGARLIQHPLVCLWRGHYVRFVEQRNGYSEYVCANCGHTFCFTTQRAFSDQPSAFSHSPPVEG